MPNPLRLLNPFIENLDEVLRGVFPRNPQGERNAGNLLVLLVALVSLLGAAVLLAVAWVANIYIWLIFETLTCYMVISARKIQRDSARLCDVLENKEEHGDLSRARLALSRITTIETGRLNRQEIIKTAIATVAENTTSGVVAPLFFIAIGGGALGVFYKAVETLREKLDHDTHEYRYFSMAATKLSDFCNFIPSKLAGFLMRMSAQILHFEYEARPQEPRDIRRASSIMMLTSTLCVMLLGIIRFAVMFIFI